MSTHTKPPTSSTKPLVFVAISRQIYWKNKNRVSLVSPSAKFQNCPKPQDTDVSFWRQGKKKTRLRRLRTSSGFLPKQKNPKQKQTKSQTKTKKKQKNKKPNKNERSQTKKHKKPPRKPPSSVPEDGAMDIVLRRSVGGRSGAVGRGSRWEQRPAFFWVFKSRALQKEPIWRVLEEGKEQYVLCLCFNI